jgi:hypothetical protein
MNFSATVFIGFTCGGRNCEGYSSPRSSVKEAARSRALASALRAQGLRTRVLQWRAFRSRTPP